MELNEIDLGNLHELDYLTLESLYRSNRDKFKARPHPSPQYAEKGKTWADYIDWCNEGAPEFARARQYRKAIRELSAIQS